MSRLVNRMRWTVMVGIASIVVGDGVVSFAGSQRRPGHKLADRRTKTANPPAADRSRGVIALIGSLWTGIARRRKKQTAFR